MKGPHKDAPKEELPWVLIEQVMLVDAILQLSNTVAKRGVVCDEVTVYQP
jgi:hypothetical protein